jgi:exodeoxyribonuclease VII large subunit
VPVIASVGHHTDRTLLDDVAAVSCSTPTHAAEAAVGMDVRESHAALLAAARRLDQHGRRAVLDRARTLARLSRAPARYVARERERLHQKLREVRATARAALVLARKAAATQRAERGRELERLRLALDAHDPQRTLERGYALVEGPGGTPLTTTADARAAGRVALRFADGTAGATIDQED